MKKWKKMFVSLLAVCILFSLSALSAAAAEDEPYSYTVRLLAGNKGTVNGQSMLTLKDVPLNDSIDFSIYDIQATDGKYYVKGIRLSGRDNNETFAEIEFLVSGDTDYVVAYGIEANKVSYTVRYLDEQGNNLLPSNTFYGDIGDKPVVAYRYIENYVPQALALEKTLQENEAENVFDFIYTPGETAAPGQTTVITVVDGTGTPAGTQAAGTATGAAAGNAAAIGAGGTGGVTTTDEGGGTIEVPDEETPQGLVDLDDEDTPKANVDLDEKESGNSVPLVVGGIIIVVGLMALGTLIVALKKRRRQK